MKTFERFLRNFQEIVFFVKTRENLPDTSLNLLKNILKSCIFRKFLNKIFSQFRKFSQNFQQIVFRPNAQTINAWILKFFEKYAKIMHFSQFS